MTDTTVAASATTTRGAALLLLLLFALSGAAALIYELVWFHLLRLSVGSSSISLAFLLGSFMGGMCLGSWLLPRLVPARCHPLRVYAVLELGIGALGVCMPMLLPWLGRLYTEHAVAGTSPLAWRGAICALGLLLPTMLMGATLPAVARWLDTTPRGLARLGWFYGANIAGAVAGTLGAGFWLLRVHDVQVATHAAVAANVLVGAAALLLSLGRRRDPAAVPAIAAATPAPATPAAGARAIHVAIALSGLTALGAEVIWTRLLSVLLGATVYSFALILAVFLVGLGLGSAVGARCSRTTPRPRAWFAACQLALPLAILWAAFAITHVLPSLEPTWIFQEWVHQNMAVHFPWDCGRVTLALLPSALLWGASFPLALAAAGQGHRDPARLVGGLYAANTLGAIGGALLAGLWAIDALGTQRAQQVLAAIATGAGALLLIAPGRLRLRTTGTVVGALALAVAAILLLPAVPPGLIAFGRFVGDWNRDCDYLYVGEGTNASVAVTESKGVTCFHVSGKVVASTEPTDMRLQRMLGHLPSLAHGAPRTVLVVGCGAGVTAGCFVDWPSVERIVVCEIEPKVADAARAWLSLANHNVLRDPRTEIVVDDARHFLATSRERFDVITSDPIHPWVRGAAALYTQEYYELVKAHLAPGGVVTQWVPLYQSDAAAVKSQVATFFDAFPDATAWSSDLTHQGYDLVLLATDGPLRFDLDRVQAQIDEDGLLRASLAEVDLGSAVALFSTCAGDAESLRDWLADAQRNVDQSLRLQYLAGLALDVYDEKAIYAAMTAGFRPPMDLFPGSDDLRRALQQALTR